MVYNFLCKDGKTRRNIYLLLLKTSLWKEVRHFFRTVYPNRSHVTTHPGIHLPEENLILTECYSVEGSPNNAINLPTTVGSKSTNTALGTCFPAPVSLKKVL